MRNADVRKLEGRESGKGTNLGLALTALFARLGGALAFHGSRRSQEDASTFGAGKSAILVVVVVVAPRNIVRDQVPAVFEVILGRLGEGWGDWGGDSCGGGDGGATRTVVCGVVEILGGIKGRESEVGGELGAVVLDLERERGERDGE